MDHPPQAPSRTIFVLAALIVAAGLGACSQESSSTAPASNQGKATSAQTAPPTVKRDLKSFDVCARVPAATVAGILASTPERITGQATMTTYASDCTYTIRRDEGAKDYAMVWLYAPEMWDPSAAGKIEKIEGLGDAAYLEKEGSGSFRTVMVLVKGNFVLDARADTPEQARELAKLALKRLTSEGG